jgi:hypothetical protein
MTITKNRREFTQCPNCGQENHDLNVPVKHHVWEFLEGTQRYDTRFWVTLKYLLFALRRVYKSSYLRTLLNLTPISLVYHISLTLLFLGTLAISIMMN